MLLLVVPCLPLLTSPPHVDRSPTMPPVCMGSFRLAPGRDTYDAVRTALEVGFRCIDTAELYDNEVSVGRALSDAGVAREAVWVTTKVSRPFWRPCDARCVREAALASLARLNLTYVDQYLLHTPHDAARLEEEWAELVRLRADGLTRSIGVSNFAAADLERVRAATGVVPDVLQLELTPWLTRVRRDELAFCEAHGVAVVAWGVVSRA